MQCIILAGGLGTRLLPLTKELPKCLIEINNQPFLYYQLKWLKKFNIDNIIICIGHLGKMIIDHAGNGNKFDLNIDYVDEGENLLGTAGAIRLAYDQNKLEDKFLVLYGDSFLPIDFSKVYKSIDKYPALMTIYKNQNNLDKSNVKKINDVVISYDKNTQNETYDYIDYGLSVITKKAISGYIQPKCVQKLDAFFSALSDQNLLKGYEVNQRFYEIGSFSGLNDFKELVNEGFFNNT
jgi:NDP-sugar pyrophosphorylase family protein